MFASRRWNVCVGGAKVCVFYSPLFADILLMDTFWWYVLYWWCWSQLKAESWHVKTWVQDYVDEGSQTSKETNTMSTNTHVCLLSNFSPVFMKMGQISHDTRITSCTYYLLVCTHILITFMPTYCKHIGVIFMEHTRHLYLCMSGIFREVRAFSKYGENE